MSLPYLQVSRTTELDRGQLREPRLTLREREVLAFIARGATSREIGLDLGISRRTVGAHRENLARKLGTSSIAGLVRYAIAHGLAEP